MDTAANRPALRWQAWVDWTGQGIWGTADGDISGDVLGLRWQWGRRGLPVPEFAPPAELELTLRNDDHRYTPGNAGGPLAGNVRSGREVWLRVSRIHDGFATSGAASTDLHGRTTSDGGARWEVMGVAGNGFAVSQGEVMGEPGGWPPSNSIATLDTQDPLATLTARYRRGSNGLGGFVLRCTSASDCLILRFTGDATILERVSGRTTTLLSTGAALDSATWYDLEIEQPGGGVRVHATRLNEAGATRREILAASAISGAPDSGRHGFWHGFRNIQDRWGAFGVGRSLFRGRIAAIDPDYDAGVCRLTATDAMERLESTRLHRALAGALMRSGDVAAAILGWAGLTPGDYALDAGRLLLTGGPRSVWDVSAGRAMRRLQREENGLIYADGLGRIRLEAASARAAVRGHADPPSLAGFSIGDTADAAPYVVALRRDDGADSVEDLVAFRYRRSSDTGRQMVWGLNEALEIPAGGERSLLASVDAWDVIAGINAPVAGTDFTATDDAAGTGTDVTGDISVELLTEAESGVAGRGHMVRVRNTGMAVAWLQSLDLHADHCWRARTSSAVRLESAAGPPDARLKRERLVQCRYADNYATAQGAAEARLAERSTQRPQIEVSLPIHGVGSHRAVAEGRLSDVVEVSAAAQGIAGAWLLEGMDVSIQGGGDGNACWWLTGV